MMSGNERAALRNYLLCFESRKKGHKPQSIVLLDLIEKYPEDEKVLSLLKKKVPKEDARRMIIGRLRDKMLSSLLLDVNMERDETYDEQAQVRVKATKGKVQGQLLISRGQRAVGFYVLERSIQLAKRFEIYDDLVEMLGIKRQHIKNWDKDPAAYYQIEQELQNYAKCRDAVNLSKKYYEEILIKYGFKGLSRARPDKEQVEFLRVRIEELNRIFEETSSATVGYFSYYVLVEFNQIQGNLSEAGINLTSLAHMIENNPSIKRNNRLATVYANIGANELWRSNFKEATSYLCRTLSYVRENSQNHALVNEYLFYSLFYAETLSESEKIMRSLIENKQLHQTELRRAQRNYLLACVSFAKGDLTQVPHYLMDSHAMDKDKEGWNIGSRVLSILHAIEKENFDYSDSLIVNLRQFMRDGLKGVEVRKRDKLILEVLLELRKHSYSFSETQEVKQTVLTVLAKDDIDTGWMLQTPEMICFHTWFNDKLNDRPYQPNYDPTYIYNEAAAQ